MKVLLLNTFDDVAGADRAARRLLQGLRQSGVAAELLVQFKNSNDPAVLCNNAPMLRMLRRLKLFLGTCPVRRYPLRPVDNFTPALLPDRLPAEVNRLAPDLVHLHWLGAGFCRIESLARLGRPLLWTLHDSWPFTGGCHVPGACLNYRERCGACPVLGSTRADDLSRTVWERKARSWRALPLTLVAPSRWLADCARASSLFRERRIEIIPNGIDTDLFRPLPQAVARQLLGLPPERPLILFGAVNALHDPNKGWALLQGALVHIARQQPDALLAVFGADAPSSPPAGLETRFLGRICDEATLVAAYSAADVFVAPSRQESFCQTALEALSCATPVVAFATSGLLDVVGHQECGYLAHPDAVDDLAHGIVWVLGDRQRRQRLGMAARHRATTAFGLASVSVRYAALYRELLAETETDPAVDS